MNEKQLSFLDLARMMGVSEQKIKLFLFHPAKWKEALSVDQRYELCDKLGIDPHQVYAECFENLGRHGEPISDKEEEVLPF